MGAVNYTTNLRLPQFGPSDKPTWQGDVTAAFKAIDDGHGTLLGSIANLQSQIITLQGQVTTLQNGTP